MSVLYGVHSLKAWPSADAQSEVLRALSTAARRALRVETPLPATETEDAAAPAWGLLKHPADDAHLMSGRGPAGQPMYLMAHCRLDNRQDLLAAFGLPDEDAHPDTALIIEAYRRHGLDCVSHLIGDWAFALWDSAHRRLLLARDATGNSAMFWWQGRDQLLFSTRLQALIGSGQVPRRPDARWMAGLLAVFTDPDHPTATAFDGVHAVPPGHCVLFEHGNTALKRWWRPEDLAPLDAEPLPDLEARFLALYDDAVRQRLRRRGGTVAATLSGGLDSGSVVALAAPALAEQGQSLTAYVHIPRFADGLAGPASRTLNEWALANQTAQHVGGVITVACPTESLSPLDGIRQWLDLAAAPSHAAGNWYWLLDICQMARAGGAQVLLTGQGGNATVSFNGSGEVWSSILAGRRSFAWSEIRQERGGPMRGVLNRLVKPVLRPYKQRLQAAMARRDGQPAWHAYCAMHPALAQATDLAGAMARHGHDATFRYTSAQKLRQFRLGLLGGADNGLAVWAALSSSFGLDTRDPTRDQRVVELCWRLPDALFWAHGLQRGLIRSSMRDRLPAAVRDSRRKGLQSSDLQARLKACRADLLAELDALSRQPQVGAWIDLPRLQASLQAHLDDRSPPEGPILDAGAAMRSLAAAMFLARHG